VATVLSKLLGRTITYRELTFEESKDAMVRAGVHLPAASDSVCFISPAGRVPSREVQ
jgi:hypothetical protein